MIVRRLSVICGKVLASEIVPVTLHRIVSLPVPAAQPFVAAFVLAAVIASRKLQRPLEGISAIELTVIRRRARGRPKHRRECDNDSRCQSLTYREQCAVSVNLAYCHGLGTSALLIRRVRPIK